MPLIVKGIQTAQDAELAVEHGIDAIYVSNHGGRDLDHATGDARQRCARSSTPSAAASS